MLVRSLMDQCLPHKEEPAACSRLRGGEAGKSSSVEMNPLGER